MGWNGSDIQKDGAKKESPKGPARRSSSRGGPILVVLLAVAALAALVAWFVTGDSDGRSRTPPAPHPPAKIVEQKPAVVPRPAPAPKKAEKKVAKPKPKYYWEQPTTNGLNEAQVRKWIFMHQPPAGYTNTTMATRPPPTYAIFPTYAENEIACLMSLKPGATLVGTPLYTDAFKEEFLKSCETPIIVSEEDDEYQAQLKRDMIQVKINLRDRMANGEDLGDILMETRNEIRRLAEIQQTVESDMRALIEGSAQSEADLDDCINAANKLLEEKGISPVKMNPIARRALIRSLGLTKEN